MRMNYLRVYAGPDGESHFEEIDGELTQVAISENGIVGISEHHPATGFVFITNPAGWHSNFHPSPHCATIVVLGGECEIETSDGDTRRLCPGAVLATEDTTGKGHRSRTIGQRENQCLLIDHTPC